MTKNGETLKYRVEQLENCEKEIEEKIDEIMNNHLVHIKEEIAKCKEEIVELRTTVKLTSIINAGAIILALMVSKLIL